jgi:hypothetical protein
MSCYCSSDEQRVHEETIDQLIEATVEMLMPRIIHGVTVMDEGDVEGG